MVMGLLLCFEIFSCRSVERSVIHPPFTSPLKPYQHGSTMNKLTEYCFHLFSACAIQACTFPSVLPGKCVENKKKRVSIQAIFFSLLFLLFGFVLFGSMSAAGLYSALLQLPLCSKCVRYMQFLLLLFFVVYVNEFLNTHSIE